MNERIVQSPVQPQIVREVAQDLEPRVRVRDLGVEQQRIQTARAILHGGDGALALVAITAKPGGAEATRPWLAHTRSSSGMAVKIGAVVLSLTRTSAWPHSRCGAGATSPPSAAVISCMP